MRVFQLQLRLENLNNNYLHFITFQMRRAQLFHYKSANNNNNVRNDRSPTSGCRGGTGVQGITSSVHSHKVIHSYPMVA